MKIKKLFKYYEGCFDTVYATQLFALYGDVFSKEPEIFALTVNFVTDILESEYDGITPLAAVFVFYARVADVDQKKLISDNEKIIDVLLAKADHKNLESYANSLLFEYNNLRHILALSDVLTCVDSITNLLDLKSVFNELKSSIDEKLYEIILTLNPFTPREAEMIKYYFKYMLENKFTSLDCVILKILFSRIFDVEVNASFVISPLPEKVIQSFSRLALARDDIRGIYIKTIKGNEENFVFQAGVLLRLMTFLLKELPNAKIKVKAA